MAFKDDIEKYVMKTVQVTDLTNGTTEWFESVYDWKNQLWTLVNELRPHEIKENVDALRISLLDLSDSDSLKRFISMGRKSTCDYMSLEKILHLMSNGICTHVIIKDFGELSEDQIKEFKEWLTLKVKE